MPCITHFINPLLMKTIVIAGGSGFLGQILKTYFTQKNYCVYILTRQPKVDNDIYWDGQSLGKWTTYLERADVLINLSGRSVDCRYNNKNKQAIYDSRIESTNVLGLAINLCDYPPKTWINSSTATIYEHSLDKAMTEHNGIIGSDFSMNIAKSWESAFNSIVNPKTRKIILRTSIVFGKNGGALKPLSQLTILGLGGRNGNGKQMVSWIHELDFARAIEYLINDHRLSGVFNLSSPNPVTNNSLMKHLRTVKKIPVGIGQPTWLVKLGARLMQTEEELVLKSRFVLPKRLLESGFKFRFEEIDQALSDLLRD